jgi:hypothetical protein
MHNSAGGFCVPRCHPQVAKNLYGERLPLPPPPSGMFYPDSAADSQKKEKQQRRVMPDADPTDAEVSFAEKYVAERRKRRKAKEAAAAGEAQAEAARGLVGQCDAEVGEAHERHKAALEQSSMIKYEVEQFTQGLSLESLRVSEV